MLVCSCTQIKAEIQKLHTDFLLKQIVMFDVFNFITEMTHVTEVKVYFTAWIDNHRNQTTKTNDNRCNCVMWQCHHQRLLCVCQQVISLCYCMHACAVMPLRVYVCVYVCVRVLAIVHGDVPPWLYMHVFFAVGFPKERALGTLVPRWTHQKTRYSMRSLKSQPNTKT